MTLKRNILANYLGAGAVSLAPVLALPWYLAALGQKQFGLISFVVMLQTLLGLLDAGTSQALVREVAVRLNSGPGGRRSTAALLFGFERIYWLFALGAGAVCLLLAGTIAEHWLNLADLPVAIGRQAVYGAAVIFAAQFPGSVYRSLLVGAQAQIALNGIMLGGALLRHLGGVMIVLAYPSLSAYLLWQAAIALLETLVRASWAWKTLQIKRGDLGWESEELRPAWKVIAGLSGSIWLGALTVQMDRIILSRMAPIEQFGYYTVAATIAIGMLQLIYPLYQAVLPRAIQLRADPEALRHLSVKLFLLIGGVTGTLALAFVTLGRWLVGIWLRNPVAAAAVYPILAVLLVGTALNAFYNVGYMNWIVHEKINRVLKVNGLTLVLAVALIPPLVLWLGTIGAAFGWLAINSFGLLLSLEWLKGKQDA